MDLNSDFFERAIGGDEPPMTLDIDSIAAAARRQGRRTVVPLAAAGAVVVGVAGVALVLPSGFGGPDLVASAGAGVTTTTRAVPVTTADATVWGSRTVTTAPTTETVPATPPMTTTAPTVIATATVQSPISVVLPPAAHTTYCYRTTDFRSAVPTEQFIVPNGSADVDVCLPTWGNGHPVPRLVACVLPVLADGKRGVVGVFPGDARTCADLGLDAATTAH